MATKVKPFKSTVIIGCGDIGLRVGRIWHSQGIVVTGLVRSAERAEKLRSAGFSAVQADLDAPVHLSLPLRDTLLYYFAPPPAKGVDDPRMQHFLAAINTNNLPRRIVYISTSGVYGNQDGELVTEQTPVNPQVDRARRRYAAEQQLRHWCSQQNVELVILRVGGIYGPGRLPLQRIKDRVPMIHEQLAPQTNRIHADDLATICVAAALHGGNGEVYNVSDGSNSNMTEYFNTIADYFNLPRPPLVDWEEAERTISAGMLSYLKESRRMDNSKMLRELHVELRYPNLKAGLESCRETDQTETGRS